MFEGLPCLSSSDAFRGGAMKKLHLVFSPFWSFSQKFNSGLLTAD
jgi:hypothetical protein